MRGVVPLGLARVKAEAGRRSRSIGSAFRFPGPPLVDTEIEIRIEPRLVRRSHVLGPGLR